jgi:DNA repair protein RecO (recombination protein O)
VLDLMAALYEGDWETAESSTGPHRSHASGLVAAHLQWHLERQLRTLPLVERSAHRSADRPAHHIAEIFRQDVPHGDEPGGQLLAGG